MTAPVLSLHQVGIVLGGRPIVRDVSFDVGAGQVVAILGANGSGKSTLVKALVGLNPISRGTVELFGTPLPRFGHWERIGYVPQRTDLAGSGVPATVREVVTSGRIGRRRPFAFLSRVDRAAVSAALDAVDLTDRIGSPVATLSGGQRQRVLVARALAGEGELLLLDEPNAGVDYQSQEAIAQTLGDRAAHGATVVVVLHELGPFAPLIDRVIALQDGRVVFEGPPDQLVDGHVHIHHHREAPPVAVPPMNAPLEGER